MPIKNIPLPFINTHIRNINNLIRLSQEPCQVPALIWAESFFPALAKALLAYTSLTPLNVTKAAIGRPGVHGLGSILRKLPSFSPTFQDGAGKYMWELTGALDKAFNWLFIAELTEEFFVDWITTGYRIAACGGGLSTAHWKGVDGTFLASPNTWHSIGCSTKVSDPDGIGNANGTLFIPSGFSGSLSATYAFRDYFTQQPVSGIQTRIVDINQNEVVGTNPTVADFGQALLGPQMFPNTQVGRLQAQVMYAPGGLFRWKGDHYFTLGPTF